MAAKATAASIEKRPFCRRLLSLSSRHSTWQVWSDFIVLFAITISNAVDATHRAARFEEYKRIIARYNANERAVFPRLVDDMVDALEANPEQDFLGSAYMELELGNDHAGQFFTPYDVCRCMAEITVNSAAEQVLDKGWVTLNDCACGAGATLIAGCHAIGKRLKLVGRNWQQCVLVSAQDIDYTVGLMCYIQLSLIGAAGYVKIGNSLTDPMCADDEKKNYWYTPVYFSDVWQYRFMFHNLDKLFQK